MVLWSLACVASASAGAGAQIFTRPEVAWETIRTEHFDVYYPRTMRAWALLLLGSSLPDMESLACAEV